MRPLLITWIVFEAIFLLIWEVQLIWFLIEEISSSIIGNKFKVIAVVLYFIIYTAIYYGYGINLAMQCLPLLSNVAELEPIGKGGMFLVEYFKTHQRAAAMLAVMSEIVMLRLYCFFNF